MYTHIYILIETYLFINNFTFWIKKISSDFYSSLKEVFRKNYIQTYHFVNWKGFLILKRRNGILVNNFNTNVIK